MWYVILALVILLVVAIKISLNGEGIVDRALIFFTIGFIVVTIIAILAGG